MYVFMPPFTYLITLVVLSCCLVIPILGDVHIVALGKPILKSLDFHLDRIVDGLSRPTGLTFLGPDDFLVIEEDTGKVKRVIDGEISQTVLDLDVSTDDSRGLIGIDSYQNGSKTFVFFGTTLNHHRRVMTKVTPLEIGCIGTNWPMIMTV